MNYIISDFAKRNGFDFWYWQYLSSGKTPCFKYYEYFLACYCYVEPINVHLNDKLVVEDNLIYVYYNDIYNNRYIKIEWCFMGTNNGILINNGKEHEIEKTVNKHLRKYKIQNILNS